MQTFGFEPDPDRARRLDRDMHAALADSLDHIRHQARGQFDLDEPRLGALIASLRGRARFPPSAFGLYYDLVNRITEGDRPGAEAVAAQLVALREVPADLEVLSIGDPLLASAADLYRRKLDTDPGVSFTFLAPPAELVQPFKERFADAMRLLDGTLPVLSGEVRGLLSQVVLAVGRPGDAYEFDGGSSYMLWGALFLNARFHETVLHMAEVIAHESAHSFLFGMSVEEPLVFNRDDELYPSPLRADPRPMDGIYHATFVSARMYWVMSELARSDALDAAGKAFAREAADADSRNFFSGLQTVEAFARLSPTGERLMASAASYMRS